MAKITRFNGNVQAFASAAPGTERTIFGEVTQANDLTSQVNADFLRGWGIVGPSDQPALEDFNAAMYTHGQFLAYLHQIGVPEYNATQEYHQWSACQSGGIIYISRQNANVGNTPTSPSSWWAPANSQRTGEAGGLGRRNVLVNASGKIKVRPYASGAATTAANQYTLDRWHVVVSGQNVSWVDAGSTRTITCPAGGLTQAIRAEDIIGGTYVLSWQGTATAQVNGVAVANGASLVLAPAAIARVKFSSGTLINPQLELGTIATAFDVPNVAAEELICQKYYYRVDLSWLIQGYTASAGQRIPDAFLTYPKMINSPLVTATSGAGVNVSVGATSAIASGLTQTATSVTAGYSSYSFNVTSLDAEFV